MKLNNKIVLITGASSGIGRACAVAFAEAGAKLLLCARRSERLQALREHLHSQYKVEVYDFTLDVRNFAEVKRQFEQLPAAWQAIDIVVNNAGLARNWESIVTGDPEDWEVMIDTNIKGLLYITRQVISGMVERNHGHVINIGSIAGHESYPNGAVYAGTKHAVRGISRGLKMDLLGTAVRVSSVDPGAVETEFSLVRFKGDEERATAVYKGMIPLTPEDISDAVLYCATRPPHVNISEILVLPTAQASSTMIHREG
jgi:3-hydroxy acid dehydrogenase/malonic semialdehyde reductase